MVVFNCNACGEALKKNQVEKHTLRCRQCQALSCVDCGKDFWGNDYQSHTKCISENEKYCGKNYVPKVNKGEAKQEQWIEKVQSAIDRSVSNPSLKGLLERLKDYPNIPRKKAKFENFLKNSLRINSQYLINQVWETLMSASEKEDKKDSNGVAEPAKELTKQNSAVDSSSQKKTESKKEKENNTNSQEENSKEEKTKKKKKKGVEKGDKTTDENDVQGQHETEVTTTNGQLPMDSEVTGNRLNKRERKEERRKQRNKVEKKDKEENGTSEKVNSRKRKLPASEEEEVKSSGQKSEKRQRQLSESENMVDASNLDTNDEESSLPKKQKGKKVKFNWTETILTVLQAKGEISLKKLQKKVLSEFAAQGATNYSEDNLRVKFDRKIKKMPQVKVLKDKAKLK